VSHIFHKVVERHVYNAAASLTITQQLKKKKLNTEHLNSNFSWELTFKALRIQGVFRISTWGVKRIAEGYEIGPRAGVWFLGMGQPAPSPPYRGSGKRCSVSYPAGSGRSFDRQAVFTTYEVLRKTSPDTLVVLFLLKKTAIAKTITAAVQLSK